MKIVVNLKDPDGFSNDVDEAVREQLASVEGLSDREREMLFDIRLDEAWAKLGRFVGCKEYLRVEFDLDTGTARVLEGRD